MSNAERPARRRAICWVGGSFVALLGECAWVFRCAQAVVSLRDRGADGGADRMNKRVGHAATSGAVVCCCGGAAGSRGQPFKEGRKGVLIAGADF